MRTEITVSLLSQPNDFSFGKINKQFLLSILIQSIKLHSFIINTLNKIQCNVEITYITTFHLYIYCAKLFSPRQ